MAKPDIILSPALDTASTRAGSEHSALTETMLQALESPNGIAIDCESESDAVALRFRFYNERTAHSKQGNEVFRNLTFKITNTSLIIRQVVISARVREL